MSRSVGLTGDGLGWSEVNARFCRPNLDVPKTFMVVVRCRNCSDFIGCCLSHWMVELHRITSADATTQVVCVEMQWSALERERVRLQRLL